MNSALPKAAHKIANTPILTHLLRAAEAAFDRIVIVVGPGMEVLAPLTAGHEVVVQHDRLGTAHAALQAEHKFGNGQVAILYADNPLLSTATLQELAARLALGDAGLVLLGNTPPDARRYGRLVTDGDYVTRIVEYEDASEAERAIAFCNSGGLMANALDMRCWLRAVKPFNKKGEYYLTDTVEIARAEGKRVAAIEAPFEECLGINSRAELAVAEGVVQNRLRQEAMAQGVAMLAPETVFLSADTILAPDVTIGPYVVFGPGVCVAAGVEIKAFSHLEGCTLREGAVIGPYARLRPGADIGVAAHIGNFVEIKETKIGFGAKINHLSYIGDAEVGAHTNIGAGTITCNYDGTMKHKTKIGERVFVGSDVALVAPVTIGDNALLAAGSVITEDVEANAMAIARGRQVNKPGRGSTK